MTAARDDVVEMRRLQARIDTLEQLLEVYERSVLEQSDHLYTEQERLHFQTTLLECQGEASLDGILSVSYDDVILFANRRLSELWGVPPPRVGTKSYPAVLAAMAERAADPKGFLERSAQLADDQGGRDEVILRDGRTFDRYTAPIAKRSGGHLGRVWSFRDITSFKEVARLKDEFISSVSHELRTPLTSIRGALDLIVGGVAGPLPTEAAELADVARNNCGRLVRLINDILDIAKIEAGRMEFRLEPREIEPLLEQSIEAIRPYAHQLGVAFRVESSASGARAQVDADRLLQVLENLLSNAARFSPAGETVQVDLARRSGQLRVSVTDRGPGIPAEFRPYVFERFTQAAGAGERRARGTGLGLSIARAIVERLHGSIGFDSTPGQGATFHFELPEWRSDRPAP